MILLPPPPPVSSVLCGLLHRKRCTAPEKSVKTMRENLRVILKWFVGRDEPSRCVNVEVCGDVTGNYGISCGQP